MDSGASSAHYEQAFAFDVEGRLSGDNPEARLLELLAEAHPCYAGRSEQAVARMRGYVLSRLARLDRLSTAVLPYLREELETGHHPYLLAASARALARVHSLSDEWIPLIERAQQRIRPGDEFLQFDSYPLSSSTKRATTAVIELERVRRSLSSDSASVVPATSDRITLLGSSDVPSRRNLVRHDLFGIELEDHRGMRLTFGQLVRGWPTFVTFFYTRCNNPSKCSANVARWGELIRTLRRRGMEEARSIAISYDPAYDTPERLAAYATDRGVELSEDHRALRVPEGFVEFQRAFGLNVGYAQATVNRHASEAFVLDREGKVAAAIVRSNWTVDEVLSALASVSA